MVPRTFRTLQSIPTLHGLADEGDDVDSSGFNWEQFFGTPAGQATIANAINMVTHATGTEAVYPTTSTGAKTFIAGNSPVVPQGLLFGGIALAAFLLLKK